MFILSYVVATFRSFIICRYNYMIVFRYNYTRYEKSIPSGRRIFKRTCNRIVVVGKEDVQRQQGTFARVEERTGQESHMPLWCVVHEKLSGQRESSLSIPSHFTRLDWRRSKCWRLAERVVNYGCSRHLENVSFSFPVHYLYCKISIKFKVGWGCPGTDEVVLPLSLRLVSPMAFWGMKSLERTRV